MQPVAKLKRKAEPPRDMQEFFRKMEQPPAYTYDMIMLSLAAAEGSDQKVKEFKASALQKGADLVQIEMAIERGKVLSAIDTL